MEKGMSRKRISPKDRIAVHDKYNGHCAYCGCKLEYRDMQVDHMESVYGAEYFGKEVNNSLDNYMPACRACNFYKSAGTIENFRTNIENSLLRNLEKNFNFKMLVKYGIVQVDRKPIRFYFEEMEQEDNRCR